jgi:hypothetical protein
MIKGVSPARSRGGPNVFRSKRFRIEELFTTLAAP